MANRKTIKLVQEANCIIPIDIEEISMSMNIPNEIKELQLLSYPDKKEDNSQT